MCRVRLHFAAILAYLFLTAGSSNAQVATGFPPFGSFGGGPDIIDNANLNVHLSVPVLNKAGRGLSFNYTLNYDSSIWSPYSGGTYGAWSPANYFGWTPQSAAETGNYTYTQVQVCCPGQHCQPDQGTGIYYNKYMQWTYIDPSRTPHAMPASLNVNDSSISCPYGTGNWSASGTTMDGSGWTLTVDGSPEATIAQDIDGHTFNMQNLRVTDSNGNRISYLTDTLGATALSISGLGTQASPTVYTFATTTGSATVTVNYTNFSIKTNYGCSGVSEYTGSNVPLVTEIDFKDEQQVLQAKYIFSYEGTVGFSGYYTGRLASITLPAGGTISYDYGNTVQHNTVTCADGSASTLKRTTPDGLWTFTHGESGTAWTTTITDPNSKVTTIHFQGLYETSRTLPDSLGSSTTCYNGAPAPCDSTAITLPVSQRTVTQTLSSKTSRTIKSFDSTYGRLTETDEYDYGNSPNPGSLIRKSIIQYASLGNGIFDRPSSATVYKSDGVTIAASTTFTYDEYTVNSNSQTPPQHVSVTGSRGNATSIASGGLTRHVHYYDTGTVDTGTDTNGDVITFNYSDSTSTCGDTFPTSVSFPLGLTSQSSYNCNGGVRTSVTDANGRQTTFSYDFMSRATYISRPDTGTTTVCFNAGPTEVDVYTSITNSATSCGAGDRHDQILLDTLGRVKTQTVAGVVTTTTYDALGRTNSVAITGSGASETYSYDAIGRVSKLTYADGNAVNVTLGSTSPACASG